MMNHLLRTYLLMIKSIKASQGGMCLPQGTDEKPVQWNPPRSHNATAQKELARVVEGKAL